MKRLFLLLLFCHYNLISQELNYAEYYKICYSAEYNVALGNKEMGWRLYNRIHPINYILFGKLIIPDTIFLLATF